MRQLSEAERTARLKAMGARRYQFKPYTSKNIGKKFKTGKCYNRPYRKELSENERENQ